MDGVSKRYLDPKESSLRVRTDLSRNRLILQLAGIVCNSCFNRFCWSAFVSGLNFGYSFFQVVIEHKNRRLRLQE